MTQSRDQLLATLTSPHSWPRHSPTLPQLQDATMSNSTKKVPYKVYPPPAPPKPPKTRISHQLFLGIRPATDSAPAHFGIIVRFPEHHPDGGDCAWYHCVGSGSRESPYRRTVNAPKTFEDATFKRRVPIGALHETKLKSFLRAFKKTKPQPAELFVSSFLYRLGRVGVLKEYELVHFLRELDVSVQGLESDPEYESDPELEHAVTSPLLYPSEI